MSTFHVELAGEVFAVHSRYPLAEERMAPFLTKKTGGVLLEALPEQEERLRAQRREVVARHGGDPEKVTPEQIEFFALHEQLAHALVPHGVLLVHGAAVVTHGAAVMFLAPSRTGKSTQTRLWTQLSEGDAFIINDDKQLLRPAEGGTLVYASPWGMVRPVPAVRSAPLKAIVRLRRGENAIRAATIGELYPELFGASLRGKTPAETAAVTNLQQRILKAAELYQMTCTPDLEAAEMAYSAIFRSPGGTEAERRTPQDGYQGRS